MSKGYYENQVLTLEEYQYFASRTMQSEMATLVRQCNWAMGLAGEAGETCDYLKKVVCHGHPLDKDNLVKELGDVLWYLAAVATEYNLSLTDIAELNIAKLKKRYPQGYTQQDSIKRVDMEAIHE